MDIKENIDQMIYDVLNFDTSKLTYEICGQMQFLVKQLNAKIEEYEKKNSHLAKYDKEKEKVLSLKGKAFKRVDDYDSYVSLMIVTDVTENILSDTKRQIELAHKDYRVYKDGSIHISDEEICCILSYNQASLPYFSDDTDYYFRDYTEIPFEEFKKVVNSALEKQTIV